ncbi:hypothetical protein NOVOSPHI9U_40720 [Novosphingobium sp. 9U]|nr:hypothetical protein NOVOSPHI9U_40720 [Novosphingobium sp. 9U]
MDTLRTILLAARCMSAHDADERIHKQIGTPHEQAHPPRQLPDQLADQPHGAQLGGAGRQSARCAG